MLESEFGFTCKLKGIEKWFLVPAAAVCGSEQRITFDVLSNIDGIRIYSLGCYLALSFDIVFKRRPGPIIFAY